MHIDFVAIETHRETLADLTAARECIKDLSPLAKNLLDYVLRLEIVNGKFEERKEYTEIAATLAKHHAEIEKCQ